MRRVVTTVTARASTSGQAGRRYSVGTSQPPLSPVYGYGSVLASAYVLVSTLPKFFGCARAWWFEARRKDPRPRAHARPRPMDYVALAASPTGFG